MIRLQPVIVFLAMLLLPIPAQAQDEDALIGVWRAEFDFGGGLHGSLVVHRTGAGYTATIGRERVDSRTRGGDLRFSFGKKGSFRGRVDGSAIDGFWIQPQAGPYQAYATPLRLRQTASGIWRGEVVPLPTRFTLWLSVFRGSDGALTAAFRNPEANVNGGASRFQVNRNGDELVFSAAGSDQQMIHSATLLHDPDRIRIRWPVLDRTIELVRSSDAEAAEFYPQPPGGAAYVYDRPAQLADGWRTASASSTGIDESALEDVVRAISSADPTAKPPQLMHSILVAHHGKLVLEKYFYGFDRATPHDTRSAGKTFASVMLGTAPARAAGLSPDSHVYQLMQSLEPFANPDPRKPRITLTHLLTHSSGLACNDNDDGSPGNEGTMQSQETEPNWWRYTLNLPQAYPPGTRYAYCSANSNLVGGALTQATGIWLPELFRRTVAEPLQFGRWYWNLMPNGEGYLGGGAFLLPRDLLKVGQAYLNGGTWNGRRIVPAEWVRESTRPRVDVTPETTGLSDEEFGNFYGRGQDALAWHLGAVNALGRSYPTYAATGNGGQVLLVVPDADLAVVFTGGNYGQGGVWTRWAQQIVGDKIIPAIRKP